MITTPNPRQNSPKKTTSYKPVLADRVEDRPMRDENDDLPEGWV